MADRYEGWGMDFVAGRDHERGIYRAHRAATDDRYLRHDRLLQAAMELVVNAFRMALVTSAVPA